MAQEKSGPQAAAGGVVEDLKGKAKEAFGSLTNNKDMKQEGQAQQDKADAERDVARKEAEAEEARSRAETHEAEQRSHQ